MAFRELITRNHPTSDLSQSKISVSFYNYINKGFQSKGYQLRIRIPKIIAREYNFNLDDRISILVDEENPRLLLLKKSLTNNGYLLSHIPRSKSYGIQMKWKEFRPRSQEMNSNLYDHAKYEDGMLINITPPGLERDPNQLIG